MNSVWKFIKSNFPLFSTWLQLFHYFSANNFTKFKCVNTNWKVNVSLLLKASSNKYYVFIIYTLLLIKLISVWYNWQIIALSKMFNSADIMKEDCKNNYVVNQTHACIRIFSKMINHHYFYGLKVWYFSLHKCSLCYNYNLAEIIITHINPSL